MQDEEIELEANQPNPEMIEVLERRIRQQESWRVRMMVKEIVNNMICPSYVQFPEQVGGGPGLE